MKVPAPPEISLLSSRAQAVAKPDEKSPIWEILDDQYDPEHNPNGYVSVGVAENRLMHAELQEHVLRNFQLPTSSFTYADGPIGTVRLRKAVAGFLNRHLKPVVPLKSSHVAIMNGVSHAIEHCSWAFADQGDAFLLGKPHYGAFVPDIALRPGVEVITVNFDDVDPMSVEAVKNYEEAILTAQKRGVTVKGLMLCSPHNPLGRCYSRDAIIDYLKLCQKYQVHFVSDEIYALSVWENREDANPLPVEFTSVLSIDLDQLIYPSLVHVLWGMSKDFGANGLRLGCLISQANSALLQALKAVGIYSYASQVTEHIAANILTDDAWTDNYIKTNQRKLAESYSFVVKFLRQHSITYAPGANAAFFLWVNLGKAYLERHPERETAGEDSDITEVVMQTLLKHRVFLASGLAFGAEQQGWFRIVFSQPQDYVEEALRRMVQALDERDSVVLPTRPAVSKQELVDGNRSEKG